MKKIKAFLELGGFIIAGTAIEKMVLPEAKKTLNINQKKQQSNYNYNTKTENIAANPLIKKIPTNSYAYGKKIIENIPQKIIIDRNLKYWLEWKIWNDKNGIIAATGEWLNKYVVGQYYKSTKFLTANDYWNYFEKKLMRLKYGNVEFKKREFYDIINEYKIFFKGEK